MAATTTDLPEDVKESYLKMKDVVVQILKKHPRSLSQDQKEISSVIILSELGNIPNVKQALSKVKKQYRKLNLFLEYMSDTFEIVDGNNWGGGVNSKAVRLFNSTDRVVVVPGQGNTGANKKTEEIANKAPGSSGGASGINAPQPSSLHSCSSSSTSAKGASEAQNSGALLDCLSSDVRRLYKLIRLAIISYFTNEIYKSSVPFDSLSSFSLCLVSIGQQQAVQDLVKMVPNKYAKLTTIIKSFPKDFLIEEYVSKGGKSVENNSVRWLGAASLDRKKVEQERANILREKEKQRMSKVPSKTGQTRPAFEEAAKAKPSKKANAELKAGGSTAAGSSSTAKQGQLDQFGQGGGAFDSYPDEVKPVIRSVRKAVLTILEAVENKKVGLAVSELGQKDQIQTLMLKLSLKHRKLSAILLAFPNDFDMYSDKTVIMVRRATPQKK